MLINVIQAILIALIPVFFLLLPGILIYRANEQDEGYFSQASKVIIWSLVITILLSIVVAFLKLPIYFTGLFILIFTGLKIRHRIKQLKPIKTNAKASLIIILFLAIYLLLSLPFLFMHYGLPTGDSQKSIFWAEKILENNRLPDYGLSGELMNRDPVDFYTPGLHTLTALVMSVSPHPLMTVGFLAIALSVAASFIGAGIAQTIFPKFKVSTPLAIFTILFILTNIRFLRYLREPGYHLQNIAGEVLLFGFLFMLLNLMRRWRRSDALLVIVTGIALFTTHQLSTFLAAFIFLPIFLLWLFNHRPELKNIIRHHRLSMFVIAVLSTASFLLLVSLDLHQKIPHIFTTQSHLLHLTPSLFQYTQLMGSFWMITGLAGLLALTIHTLKSTRNLPVIAFISASFVLILLSQGPRLGINIPPVRTLFYSVIPLSITASYLITSFLSTFLGVYPDKLKRILALAVLILAVSLPSFSSISQAYALSHAIRTNSTLTIGQQKLINHLKKDKTEGAVLIDDYNRRSTSWLLLGNQAVFTRIAADLKRQMNEAHQSETRYNLYLAHLDYEKIFSMGSSPAIVDLMNKHGISRVTGIAGTSNSVFQHNPALGIDTEADDITIYSINPDYIAGDTQNYSPRLTAWLLRPTTLVNDIGNRQDTFAHLPASLRTTRLSDPRHENGRTWRTGNAPYIPLEFNVGSYTEFLFDQEKTGYADTSLELFIDFEAAHPEHLSIITPAGQSLPLVPGETLRIDGKNAPWDDDGIIHITIHNPAQQPVNIYIIALGLSQTP